MKWKGENILLHILLSGLPKYTRQRSCCFTHQQEQYTRWKIPVSLLNGVLIHKISSVMDKKLFYSEMFHRVWQCRDDKNQRALKVLSPTHEHSLAWNNYLMCLKGKKKKKKKQLISGCYNNWFSKLLLTGGKWSGSQGMDPALPFQGAPPSHLALCVYQRSPKAFFQRKGKKNPCHLKHFFFPLFLLFEWVFTHRKKKSVLSTDKQIK